MLYSGVGEGVVKTVIKTLTIKTTTATTTAKNSSTNINNGAFQNKKNYMFYPKQQTAKRFLSSFSIN